MKQILILIFSYLIFVNKVYSQATIPVAQTLPYSQDFSTLAASSTAYPAGWQGWQLSASGSSAAFRTTAPTANLALLASSTAATNTGGVHNYNQKLGILASGSSDPSLCLVVNTTSKTNIAVTFDISTLRNPFNGTTETRRNNVELQYCVGSAVGTFTSLTGTIYRNNTTTQITAITTPQNGARYRFILPVACENQSAVQLRWVQRDSSGTNSRPSFAIDNVIVAAAPIVSASVTPSCTGLNNGTITLSISGGMPPYTVSWDTINKNGPSFAVTAVTKTAQHPYFGVGFTVGFALDGIQGKELTVTRGVNYTFSGTFVGHPFHISTSTAGGNFLGEVSSGVTNSQTQNGALVFTPNSSHAALLWYQCGVHLNMGWRININNGYQVQNITNRSPGTYTAAVTSLDGGITTITVTVPSATSPTATANNNGPVCENETLSLQATGGNSYAWTGPNSFTSGVQNPVLANPGENGGGIYTVTVTALNGCTAQASTTVTVDPTPDIYSFTPATGAEGTTVTLSGNDFTNTLNVKMNNLASVFAVVNDSTITFEVPAGASSDQITVLNSNNCSRISDSLFTVVNNATLNLKLYIEGFYSGGQMISSILDPLNPTVADTLTVLLYDPGDLTQPAYLTNNVIDLDGNGTFVFPAAVAGHVYYIAVKHRNTIEVWSKNPVTFSLSTNFDFTQ